MQQQSQVCFCRTRFVLATPSELTIGMSCKRQHAQQACNKKERAHHVLVHCSSGAKRRTRKGVATPEDEARLARQNAAAAKWKEFWRNAKPSRAPVPSHTARFAHLLSLSAGSFPAAASCAFCMARSMHLVVTAGQLRTASALLACTKYTLHDVPVHC